MNFQNNDTKSAWEVECEARGLDTNLKPLQRFSLNVLYSQLDEITNMVDTFDGDHQTASSLMANKEMVKITHIVESAEDRFSADNPFGDSCDQYDVAIEKELVW